MLWDHEHKALQAAGVSPCPALLREFVAGVDLQGRRRPRRGRG
jgi:hypothetical protein